MKSIFLMMIAAAAGAALMQTKPSEELLAGDRQYCEMVALYQESGGQYGWPDYKGNAARECK